MNITEGRETHTLDSIDMTKIVADFRLDSIAASSVPDRNQAVFQVSRQSSSSLPMPSLVKSTGEIPVTLPLSKRPDSIMTTAKQMAKAIRPTSAMKNARLNDLSKTNGSVTSAKVQGRMSGYVCPADGILPSPQNPMKPPPIEMRPIQPAVNLSTFTSLPAQAPAIAVYRHPSAITLPGSTVPPLLFMQQDNSMRFQPASISIASIPSPSVQSPTVSPLRFPVASVTKPPSGSVVKSRKRASPPDKWLATIKPDIKPKPSMDVLTNSAVSITPLGVRPQGSLDGLTNGFAVTPTLPKRPSGEADSATPPKKRSRKKFRMEDSPTFIGITQTFPKIVEGARNNGSLSNLMSLGTLPGISAMMSRADPTDKPYSGTEMCSSLTSPTTHCPVPVHVSCPPTYSVSAMCEFLTGPIIATASSDTGHDIRTVSSSSMGPVITSTIQPAFSPSQSNENDVASDIFSHEASCTLSPSPPAMIRLVARTNETENGAFRKKTRLIYDSGVRKIQQINHEASSEHSSFNGTEMRTVTIGEKPVLVSSNINRSSNSRSGQAVDSKPPKKARKPRSDKGISPRLPKQKKEKAVVTTTKIVPVKLELKRSESEEQTLGRMKRLAHKWSSLSEDSIRWLVATKSVDQLKVIRWLRLVDRAFVQAEMAKNFEKMERLRDSKIQAIMDLEKLQAPFEPRLMHFLHPNDLEKKNRLIKKYFTGQRLTSKNTKWLKDHYNRLRFAEQALPGLGASTDSVLEKSMDPPIPPSLRPASSGMLSHPGNERGNFQAVGDSIGATHGFPTAVCIDLTKAPTLNSLAVQTAHQFVRKFPDSTRAMIEVDRNGLPCAVLLLIQQPNCKAVHIKKRLRPPVNGFGSADEAFSSAIGTLNHLVMKFLGTPSFPLLIRYPLTPDFINDRLPASCLTSSRASVLSFSRETRGWQTIQYVDSNELGVRIEETVSDQDFDLANDIVDNGLEGSRPSLLQDYRSVCPILPVSDQFRSMETFGKQILSRKPVDLTVIANDPVEQRRWLCWELRHVSQQYWQLDSCQQARENWYGRLMEKVKTMADAPEATSVKALRFVEAVRVGLKKSKASTVLVNRTIKMGEQVKDVLESYKKERPMTRRKRAKMSQFN